MLLNMIKLLLAVLIFCLFLSGCATPIKTEQPDLVIYTAQERHLLMQQIQKWQVNGKIAFLQEKKRESANLLWKVDEQLDQQSLNMTTYLGINILSLEQTNEQSTIEVDGETHQSDDLDLLIWHLTGYPLPTEALHAWIKGITYLPDDKITYGDNFLPTSIRSNYDGMKWHIQYQAYQQVNQLQLPKKITITQNQFTIKIAINHWTL